MSATRDIRSKSQARRDYAWRIGRVIDYINVHLDEPLRVQALSEIACFSPCHFHRQFTACTGITVSRLVQLLRLKRASLQLAFNPQRSITDIAFDAGFANAESFSRAFRKQHGQSPSAFRASPQWQPWQTGPVHRLTPEFNDMHAEIVDFPDTMVAALEHHGPEHLSYRAAQTFIEWRRANGIGPTQGKTYGIHYSDPVSTLPEDYRLDICVSVDAPVAENPQGVVTKLIPGGRCACVRHHGSRDHVTAAEWLYREWLPASGEELRDFPVYFHYVNVGPGVQPRDMITDVYLPLK
jgi:AraC family transcriptional regulator